jgi:hypothetical protein
VFTDAPASQLKLETQKGAAKLPKNRYRRDDVNPIRQGMQPAS